jgi:hypothetical protein
MNQTGVPPFQSSSIAAAEQMNDICLDDVTAYHGREEKAVRTIQVQGPGGTITENQY